MTTQKEPTFGEKIQNARKKLGWSQSKLAEHLGMVQATVSRAENDERQQSTLVTRSLERFVEDVENKVLLPEAPAEEATNAA